VGGIRAAGKYSFFSPFMMFFCLLPCFSENKSGAKRRDPKNKSGAQRRDKSIIKKSLI